MKIVQQMYSSTYITWCSSIGGSTRVFCCVLHGSSPRDGLRFSSPLFSTSPSSSFYAVQVHSRLNRTAAFPPQFLGPAITGQFQDYSKQTEDSI